MNDAVALVGMFLGGALIGPAIWRLLARVRGPGPGARVWTIAGVRLPRPDDPDWRIVRGGYPKLRLGAVLIERPDQDKTDYQPVLVDGISPTYGDAWARDRAKRYRDEVFRQYFSRRALEGAGAAPLPTKEASS